MKAWTLVTLGVIGIGCGCVPGSLVQASPPDGFVPVDRGTYHWRAMSADGVVLGLRSFDNEPRSTLEFWSKVVRTELESTRGYVHETSEAVGAALAMLFAADGESYYIALSVTPDRIWVLEAGGRREAVARELPAIRAAVTNLKAS